LKQRRFERIRLPIQDALVARVSDSVPPPAAVQAKIDERVPQRWYPVEGGAYLVKWIHRGPAAAAEGFWIEAGGWNHEHCDACNRHIPVGRTLWQTVRGSIIWLCPYCYRRLLQLGRSEK
jgi:hypothetical protein